MSPVPVQTAVLLALQRHGESYGLQVIEYIRADSGGGLEFQQGAIYPTLRKLERDGLLKSRTGDPPTERGGGRPKVYYRLTAAGHRLAQEHLRMLRCLVNADLDVIPS